MGIEVFGVIVGMGWLCWWHGRQKDKIIWDLREQLDEAKR